MVAKIIVWDKTRAGAISRMNRCLQETVITGIKTNIQFQQKIINNAFYRRGELTTDFLQRRILNGADVPVVAG